MWIKNSINAGALALTALLSLSQAALSAGLGTTYETVLQGAKQEGRLEVWVVIPTKPETHRAVIEAFNKEFGLNTEVNWVPTSPVNALSRTIAEAQGNRVTVDVLEGSEEELAIAIKEGVALKVDWAGIFAKRYPKISSLEVGMIQQYLGYAIPYFDYPYGIAWNPNQIDDAEVPTKFTDLADPKWSGRFGLNQFSMVPIPILAPFLGAEKTITLAKQILANRPVLIRGTPAVAQAVVTGSIPIGVTGYSAAEAAIRNGEPLKFKLFEDFVPTAIQHLYVAKGSPAPNTAALFIAWFASEGYKVANQIEPTPPPQDLETKLAKMTAEVLARGATHAKITKIEQLDVSAEVRNAISLMMSGQN
jgi:iron(III) transport system substrate-binding protein